MGIIYTRQGSFEFNELMSKHFIYHLKVRLKVFMIYTFYLSFKGTI